MLEERVFTVEATIEVIKKTKGMVVDSIETRYKNIIPDRKFDIETNCILKNANGTEYVNAIFDGYPSPYFIRKDIIPEISREIVKRHIEIKDFASIEAANEFLKRHLELTLENVNIRPYGTNGALFIYYIDEGDKGVEWIG